MLKIKLNWIEQKKCSKIIDINISHESLREEIGYLEDINSEEDLKDYIYDYIKYNSDPNFLYNLLTDDERENYYDDLECEEILEIDELVTQFSYLISEKIKLNCCTGQTGNYCSHCGAKLN